MTVDQTSAATDQRQGLGRPVPQSADPIDRVVRLAPKWTVFVLIACGLLVLGTIIWAVTGTVTSSVRTTGMYTEHGAVNVVAKKAGVVERVLVTLDQKVTKGQQLVALEGGQVAVSPQDGAVTSILVSDGAAVIPGTSMVRVTDAAELDTVVTVVPVDLTGIVYVGLEVRMDVAGTPSSQYGYLLGTVAEISSDPYTVEQIAQRLDLEEQVIGSLLGAQPGLLATIKLEHDPSTPSSYRWSVGEGPPWVITQGVPVKAQIILDEQHPVEVVFPGLDRDGS
jgi:multidrug efflux pump subunit AcrA (membrane-fusion protein)